MREFKGTPGEWKAVLPQSSNGWYNIEVYKKDSEYDIATLYYGTSIDDFEEVRANAKLIAAAPELLKSCINLIKLLAFYGYKSPKEIEEAQKVIDKALGND